MAKRRSRVTKAKFDIARLPGTDIPAYGPDSPVGSNWDDAKNAEAADAMKWTPEGTDRITENIVLPGIKKIIGEPVEPLVVPDPSKIHGNEEKASEEFKYRFVSIKKAADWWADKSRENPALYGEFVFGYEAAPHHKNWLSTLLDKNYDRFLIIAPRESAKSSWMVVLLAWSMGHFPLSTNFIGSVTAKQAEDRLRMVSDLYEYNPRHRLVFPELVPDNRRGWRLNEINIRSNSMPYNNWMSMVTRYGSPKDASLFAAGSGSGAVIGRRFSGWGIIDDPHDEDNSATEAQREKIFTWYQRTYINCLQAQARSCVITTRWNEDDLAGRLKKIPSYKVIEVPAISIVGDIETSYWPEHWPLSRLYAKRDEIGDALFGALYMNDVHALTGNVFIIDWLRKDLPDPLPEFTEMVISVDPALKKTAKADNTAIMLVGMDKRANYYVLDVWVDKWSPNEIVSNVEAIFNDATREFGFAPKVLVESVAYQETLATLMSEKGAVPDNLLFPIKPNTDKVLRARMPSARAQAGRVFIAQHKNWTGMLQSQFCSFTGEPHGKDDIVDAFTQAINFLDVGTSTQAKLHKVVIPGII